MPGFGVAEDLIGATFIVTPYAPFIDADIEAQTEAVGTIVNARDIALVESKNVPPPTQIPPEGAGVLP